MSVGDIIKLRTSPKGTLDELHAEAKEAGVEMALLVGIDKDGRPWIECAGQPTMAQMCWMMMALQNQVQHEMIED